jgi:hypothetical protein
MLTVLTIIATAVYIRATAEIIHLTAKSQAVAYPFACFPTLSQAKNAKAYATQRHSVRLVWQIDSANHLE